MASGSAVSSCSGREMRSKKRLTGRNASLTVRSAVDGCSSCWSTGALLAVGERVARAAGARAAG